MQVPLDFDALEKYMDENSMTRTEMGNLMGRSSTFIRSAEKRGYISQVSYNTLLRVTGMPEGSFIKPKRPAEAPAPQQIPIAEYGYTLGMEIYDGRVRVIIRHDGDPVVSAFSRIKGDSELDLIQAISYAAHMCYKFAEQAEMSKGE